MTYHGVDDRTHPVVNFDRLQAAPELFTRQVEKLARAFCIVDLRDAVRHFIDQGTWPERALAITFDDGYKNNLEIVAPVLRQVGVPATFFVTAGFVEGRTTPWWYDLRQGLAEQHGSSQESAAAAMKAEEKLRPMTELERENKLAAMGIQRGAQSFYPFMSRSECRQLVDLGFDVQCHGDTHASFAAESSNRVKSEIRKAADFVRSLGVTPWGMAYPYGHEPIDRESARIEMASNGVIAAVTTREGSNGKDADLLALRRWDLHGGYSALGALVRVS